MQCDRTGATQIVGTVLCPGFHDYIALVNSKGGVEGHKIKALEIDHEYKVPPAVESYERHKKEGAVTHRRLRHAADLCPRREADRGQDPRHVAGLRQRGRRRRHQLSVHLPDRRDLLVAGRGRGGLREEAARRQPQGQEDRVSSSTTTRPAASRSRCSRTWRAEEGFQLKTFAVPPPGVEMGAQVLDIAQRYRADFVIAHLFGGAPAVSIKELKRVGLPAATRSWRSCGARPRPNIEAAGGFAVAEGYYTMQFAGVGQRLPGAERDPRDVQEAGQAGAEGDGARPCSTIAACSSPRSTWRPSATR